MILSASRRTDIPAFYSEWFINRLKEGFVLVPNPYNPKQLSRITLSPETVDCIVFWSKNTAPMFDKLVQIEELGYRDYYFEFTITPYDKSIEKGLPPKSELIQTFQRLSDKIGLNRVDWRFDPIIINGQITENLILSRFEEMCKQLAGYTTKCIISYIDIYRHTDPVFKQISKDKQLFIAKHLADIASGYKLPLYTCSEEQDFSLYGIGHSACIDKEKIESIVGCKLVTRKDSGQRKNCGCVGSIDIGMYNTCSHGCSYCYATTTRKVSERKKAEHDPNSPVLAGSLDGVETVIPRIVTSLKADQRSIAFDD